MRHDYQLFTFGGSNPGDSFGHSINVPNWADFGEIENDGGRPLLVHMGSHPIPLRTGARFPLLSSALRVTRDATENTAFAPLARLALLSAEIARVQPPPSDEPTRVFQQKETVVQAAGARLITFRQGILFASIRFPTANGLATGQVFIADTQAKATATVGIELLPGEAFEAWDGPLWVFRPATAANADIDVTQSVKDLGVFT